jgi:thioredoxin reductase (NADPH)
LFYAIGHTPNTAFLDGQIETDETGYVVTYSRVCEEAINGTKPLSSEKAQKFQDGKTRFPTATSVS